jgi:hypothetical protein
MKSEQQIQQMLEFVKLYQTIDDNRIVQLVIKILNWVLL